MVCPSHQLSPHSLPVSCICSGLVLKCTDSAISCSVLKLCRYNSVVFSSFSTNNYTWLVITEDFLLGPFTNESITGSGPVLKGSLAYNRTYGDYSVSGKGLFANVVNNMSQEYLLHSHEFQNLSTLDCLLADDSQFLWRPNLYMVTSRSTNISTLLGSDPDYTLPQQRVGNASLRAWGYSNRAVAGLGLCDWSYADLPKPCSRLHEWTEVDIRSWTFRPGFVIDYCLRNPGNNTESGNIQRVCHLQCSPLILLSDCCLQPLQIWY
jgi:hypothetical protein